MRPDRTPEPVRRRPLPIADLRRRREVLTAYLAEFEAYRPDDMPATRRAIQELDALLWEGRK